MQNEPNLKNAQINVTPVKTKVNENKRPSGRRKNEPNLRQNKPNFKLWAGVQPIYEKYAKRTQFAGDPNEPKPC